MEEREEERSRILVRSESSFIESSLVPDARRWTSCYLPFCRLSSEINPAFLRLSKLTDRGTTSSCLGISTRERSGLGFESFILVIEDVFWVDDDPLDMMLSTF